MLGWAAEHLPGCDWDPEAPPGGWADACANRAAHAGQDAPRGTLFAAYYTLLDREELFCRPPSIGDSEARKMSLPPLEPLDEPAGERLPGRAADRKDRRLDGLFAVVRGMLEQARDEELGVVSADRRWVQVVATGRMAERVQEPFLESVYARLANAARLYYARTGQEVLPIRRHDEAAATPFAPFMRLLLLLVEPGEGWRDQVSPDVAAELRRTRAQTTTHLVIMHVLDEYDELPCPEEDNGIGPATALAVRVGERAVLGLLDESDAALRALLIDLHASWDRKSRPGLPAGRPTKAGRLLEWLEQVDLQ